MQVLMSGHLSQGEARVTFLYADLLSRAKLFRTACLWGSPVSALIDRRPRNILASTHNGCCAWPNIWGM